MRMYDMDFDFNFKFEFVHLSFIYPRYTEKYLVRIREIFDMGKYNGNGVQDVLFAKVKCKWKTI